MVSKYFDYIAAASTTILLAINLFISCVIIFSNKVFAEETFAASIMSALWSALFIAWIGFCNIIRYSDYSGRVIFSCMIPMYGVLLCHLCLASVRIAMYYNESIITKSGEFDTTLLILQQIIMVYTMDKAKYWISLTAKETTGYLHV